MSDFSHQDPLIILWEINENVEQSPISQCIESEKFIDLQLFFKMFSPINAAKFLILIMFSFTLDIYCTSVRPGRGIPHMWLSLRFLLSFYLLKGFFSSFSLLLLRVKGRGCHTLLKPYEMNCGLWIWAIQIKFDWLIDWKNTFHPSHCREWCSSLWGKTCC